MNKSRPMSAAKRPVCVVGSFNADIIAYTSPSQSTSDYNIGLRMDVSPGGKGFNVASSIASTGIETYLVGRIGNDVFGGLMSRQLKAGLIHPEFVKMDAQSKTGVGHVRVSAAGEYDTCVIAGANANVSTADVDIVLNSGLDFSTLVLEFEIPIETALYAARKARSRGIKTVVNFSPFIFDAIELLQYTDVLVVNEGEAYALWTNLAGDNDETTGALGPMIDFLRLSNGGPRDVVVTLGNRGVYAMNSSGEVSQLSGHSVPVTNVVGAGDSFLAVLVSQLAQGVSLLDSIRTANAAGAVACTKSASWLTVQDYRQVQQLALEEHVSIGRRARKVK